MTTGILAYGAYVPSGRLDRASIGATLGAARGSGSRSVASFDEDAVTMSVEAAQRAIGAAAPDLRSLIFSSPAPPYADKTNAAIVHAALGLPSSVGCFDANGAVRSATGALGQALRSTGPTLVVAADVRVGLPGGADESEGGDGAAALVVGQEVPGRPVIAELLSTASQTEELLDRWREPGAATSHTWEERFGESIYVPAATEALRDACALASIDPTDVDRLLIAGLHGRANRRFGGSSGSRAGSVRTGLEECIGNTGAAAPALALIDAIEGAEAGDVIALVVLADGVDALLFRVTAAVAEGRAPVGLRTAVAEGRPVAYPTYLSWRGLLTREPPRRPDPVAPAAPPSQRNGTYKFAFVGSRCTECGAIHLPPGRVCISCRSVDSMAAIAMAAAEGAIATFTIDHLAHTPDPPLAAAVIDFDDGGRFKCQLTDCSPDGLAVGQRVRMAFRRISSVGGIHNYAWKARPVMGLDPESRGGD